MKKLLLFLLLIPLFSIGQFKVPEQTPQTYVFDYDNILTADQVAHLNNKIVKFKDTSTIQIAIVVLSDLQGYDMETVANAIFNKWGIGDKNINNGILYLVSPKNRMHRLEVGKGLEGDLTDAESRELLQVAKPFFKDGEYYTGIERVLTATIDHLKPISWQQRVLQRNAQLAQEKIDDQKRTENFLTIFTWIGLGILGVILIATIANMKRKAKEERRRKDGIKKMSESIITTFNNSKKQMSPGELEKEFDQLFAKLKALGISRADFREKYKNAMKEFMAARGNTLVVTGDARKHEENVKIVSKYKDAASNLNILLSSMKSKLREIEEQNNYVINKKRELPDLKKRAEAMLKHTPWDKDRLHDSVFKTVMGAASFAWVLYPRVKTLVENYETIINYKRDQELRIKREKEERDRIKRERDLYNSPEQVAKRKKEAEAAEKRRKKEEEEDERRGRRNNDNDDNDTLSGGLIGGLAGSMLGGNSDPGSGDFSQFDFGGGSSGGGGASDNW